MKDTTKAFLKGLAVGVAALLLLAGIHACVAHFEPFGKTVLLYDEAARPKIAANKFALSPRCTDLFYYINGFQDHNEFLAFSGPQKELDQIVEVFTGKKLSALKPYTGPEQIEEWQRYPPDAYLRRYYDLSTVTRGLFLAKPPGQGESFWYLLYDRDGGRVYYYWGNM